MSWAHVICVFGVFAFGALAVAAAVDKLKASFSLAFVVVVSPSFFYVDTTQTQIAGHRPLDYKSVFVSINCVSQCKKDGGKAYEGLCL